MFANRFVLWDLDGTLADTAADLVDAANATRAELGLALLEPEVVRSHIGGGARRLIDRVFGEDQPAELRDRALATFRRLYAERLCVHTAAFPGVESVVRALDGRQAVATNKPGEFARPLIEQLGWGGHFCAVVGGDDVERPKPAPDVLLEALSRSGASAKDAVLIGDSEFDAGAARACGIPYVHVRWGYARTDCEALAAVCVSTGDELADVLGIR